MKMKRYFIALLSASVLASNFTMTAHAMGKIDTSKAVNGASKPATGAAGAVAAPVVGAALIGGQPHISASVVVGATAIGAVGGAVKGAKSGREADKYPQNK